MEIASRFLKRRIEERPSGACEKTNGWKHSTRLSEPLPARCVYKNVQQRPSFLFQQQEAAPLCEGERLLLCGQNECIVLVVEKCLFLK